MSWLANPDNILPSGWLASEYDGLGVLGADVPDFGISGSSPLLNDGLNLASEYRWWIESLPLDGTLTVYENGAFEFSGAADGTYSFVYRLFEDGADYGTATVYLQVGPANFSFDAFTEDAVPHMYFGDAPPSVPFSFDITTGNTTASLSFSGVPGTILDPSSIKALADALWSHPNAVTFMRLLGLR